MQTWSYPELVMYYCRHEQHRNALNRLIMLTDIKRYRNTTDEKFYCDHNAYLYVDKEALQFCDTTTNRELQQTFFCFMDPLIYY